LKWDEREVEEVKEVEEVEEETTLIRMIESVCLRGLCVRFFEEIHHRGHEGTEGTENGSVQWERMGRKMQRDEVPVRLVAPMNEAGFLLYFLYLLYFPYLLNLHLISTHRNSQCPLGCRAGRVAGPFS